MLKGILSQDLQQRLGLWPQIRTRKLPGVLLRLPGVVELPAHQLSFFEVLLSGSCNPFRIDSRIPGIDSR